MAVTVTGGGRVTVTTSGGGAVAVSRSPASVATVNVNNLTEQLAAAQAAVAAAQAAAAAAQVSALAALAAQAAAEDARDDAQAAAVAAEAARDAALAAEVAAEAAQAAAEAAQAIAVAAAGNAAVSEAAAAASAFAADASADAAAASASAANASAIAAAASAASITLPLPIASGGTGQTTAPLALAALGGIGEALLTTRGDVITRSATVPQRLALGAAGRVLMSDGTDAIYGTLVAGSFATGPGIVTPAMLNNGTALTVLGRSVNTAGARGDILAANDGEVLRRSGTTLGFGTLPNTSITGLGTMSTQAASAVAITGGTVSGLTSLGVTGSSPVTVTYVDAGASAGPLVTLYRDSSSPAPSDQIGALYFAGRDSVNAQTNYAGMTASIVDATDATEDGELIFQTVLAGSYGTRFRVGGGLYTQAVTGGDKGLGTINATTIYQQNVALASAAFVATGTSGATIPLNNGNLTLSGNNTYSGSSSFTGTATFNNGTSTPATYTWSDNGALAGPLFTLSRVSASAAASDGIGGFLFQASNSTPAAYNYGLLYGVITDPTAGSEDFAFAFQTSLAGTLATRLNIGAGVYSSGVSGGDKGAGSANFTTIYQNNVALGTAAVEASGASGHTLVFADGNNTWAGANQFNGVAVFTSTMQITSVDGGAAAGPDIQVYRNSASPAANDFAGQILLLGNNSVGTGRQYINLACQILDPTNGSEDSALIIYDYVAGAQVAAMQLANGMILGAPTGSFKGTGTINCTAAYDDNVLLTCYVLEAEREGSIDARAWDARVDDYAIPAVTEKRITKQEVREPVFEPAVASDGKPLLETVEVDGQPVTRQAQVKVGERVVRPAEFEIVELEPAREEPRLHEPARRFAADRMDELDPATFTAKWRTTGVLPGFPTPEEYAAMGGLSTGMLGQRLWELCELQAVHIGRLTDRLAALEARAPE